MIIILKSIMRCEILCLDESFQGTCFGHFLKKFVNMLQLMKRFAKTCYLFLLTLYNQICKNV
jgi:hypothetical protein